jgi:hypothetical protein
MDQSDVTLTELIVEVQVINMLKKLLIASTIGVVAVKVTEATSQVILLNSNSSW